MQRDKASLPVRYGSLGLRSCAEIAISSYLTSCYASAPLARLIVRSSITQSRDLQDEKVEGDT